MVTRVGYHQIGIRDSSRACRVGVYGAGVFGGLQMCLSPAQTSLQAFSELAHGIIYAKGKSQIRAKKQNEVDRHLVKAAFSGVPRQLGISPFQRAFPFSPGGAGFFRFRFENVLSHSFWNPSLYFTVKRTAFIQSNTK